MLLQLSFRCLARVSHRATLAAVQLHTSAASKQMRFVLSLQLCHETVSVVGKDGGDYGCWKRKPRQMLLATNACQQDRRRVQVATWEPPASPYGLIEEQLFGDPWRLLVACILLNQTTAKGVRPHPPPPPSPPARWLCGAATQAAGRLHTAGADRRQGGAPASARPTSPTARWLCGAPARPLRSCVPHGEEWSSAQNPRKPASGSFGSGEGMSPHPIKATQRLVAPATAWDHSMLDS